MQDRILSLLTLKASSHLDGDDPTTATGEATGGVCCSLRRWLPKLKNDAKPDFLRDGGG